MNPLLLLNHPEIKKWVMVCLAFIASTSLSTNLFSQTLSQRQVWDGPFDIKMIAAPALEPVYVNPSGASSGQLLADSVVRHSTIVRTGGLMNINNDYKGGSPFKSVSIPMSAILCGDPNVGGCTAGLPTVASTTTCPVKYNNPTYVSKIISMTYADYDTDLTTYSSSMAQLDISSCSEIEAAYLYWAGMFKGSNDDLTLVDGPTNSFNGVNASTVFNVATGSGYNSVKFKIPGGAYQTITADAIISPAASNKYVCMKNVTSIVNGTGGGQFWVGNLQSYPIEGGGGSSSGWTMVVIFRNPLSPPRRISLFDGLQNISSTGTFTLTGLQTPSTTNFKSYVGFASLDAEDVAAELGGATPIGMGFKTNNGSQFEINPFLDQPKYRLYTNKGYPADCGGSDNLDDDGCKVPIYDATWCSVYDGVASSHITTYNEVTDKNGNEITRLPTHVNTLGFDAHHMKLPNGSIPAGATSASITLSIGGSGSFDVFMSYIAIERLQPKLEMTKVANKNTTALSTQITYTLTVKNKGNTPSLGGDIIYDTLDVATDYAGGLTSKRYVNGAVTTPAPGVSLLTSALNRLQINLANPIGINDSVQISFNVQVKDYASNVALWDVQCKRTIENTAYVKYNTASSGILQSKSNSNDCGIGSETKVLVFDAQLDASNVTVLGPFDACTYLSDAVIPHVRSRLVAAGVSSSVVNDFDIRNSSYVRLDLNDQFNTAPNNTMSFFAIRDFSTSGNCQQIYEVKFSSCLLPVELISFNGWKNQNTNVLVWITASEENNKEFIIERSVDGKHFTAIGSIGGNGNSSIQRSYRFEDERPYNGDNFYRLKQVDHNGAYTYSNVIAISNEKADVTIYPNPNEGSFTLRLIAADQPYLLDITDLNGRVVYSTSGEVVPQSIELSGIAKGIYFVRLNIEQNTVIKKMIVY